MTDHAIKAKRRTRDPIRMLLADDHALFCESLHRALENEQDIELVHVLHDLKLLKEALDTYRPDVIVLDLEFPNCSSIDVINSMRRFGRLPAIVILSMYADADAVVRSQQAGALGFVAKGDDLTDLLEAIRCAYRGKIFLSPQARNVAGQKVLDFSVLTRREKDVLALIIKGHSLTEAADLLGIAYKTAHMHQQSAITRMNASSLNELVASARQASRFTGLFSSDS